MSTPVKTWIRYDRNVQLELDDFYISFNAGDHVIPAFAADDGGSETAIVKDGKFYILNGDHREAYEALVDQGFAACARYFQAHPDEQSSWSNGLDDDVRLLEAA